MKKTIEKIKFYMEIITFCGTLIGGFWFGVVKPALQDIIHEEIVYTNFFSI